MIWEQYRDDLLNRFASHTFTETAVSSMTLVEFNHDDTIDSVSDSGGTARFNFASGPTLVVGSQVTNSSFTTNTDYNGSHVVAATDGTTYYEVTGISFGTSETGDMAALIGSSQTLDKLDAYREIREDLVALRSEVMITVTEAQRDAWTGTPYDGEGLIFNSDGSAELYDGTSWTPA